MRSIFITLGLLVTLMAGTTAFVYAAPSEGRIESPPKKVVAAKKKVFKRVVSARQKSTPRAEIIPLKPSFGQIAGLHGSHDSLA